MTGIYELIKKRQFLFFKNPGRGSLRHEPGFQIKKKFAHLETCFPFLIHCWPISARDVSHFKITKKKEKVFSDFSRDFYRIYLTRM